MAIRSEKSKLEITYEDINKYFERDNSRSECKKNEYVNIIKNRDRIKYYTIASKNQIGYIMKISNNIQTFGAYQRLLPIITKFVHIENYHNFIKSIIGKNDEEIYGRIYKYINSNISRKVKRKILRPYEDNYNLGKCKKYLMTSESAVHFLKNTIGNIYYNLNYMYIDIGCGNCSKTKIIGESLGLSFDNVYGADIDTWGNFNESNRNKNINFIPLEVDKKFNIDNGKFDLVSLLMVLHHVKGLDFFMNEINRITKINGYVFIREHDVMTNLDRMLCDVEHAMYEVGMRNNKKFFQEYYGEYKNIIEWNILFDKYGFNHIRSNFQFDNLYANISPTRYFYSIFQKISNISV